MNRVSWFELMVPEPAKTLAFFQQAFGWEDHPWEGDVEYHMVNTGPKEDLGIDGGIGPTFPQLPPMVNVIQVENIDETVAKIIEAGGSILLPKTAVPCVGWVAYFKAPGEVIMGVMQSDVTVE